MKDKSVLIIVIVITIIWELLLIAFIYTKVGPIRLPVQLIRLLIQVLFISFIFGQNSKKAEFMLAGYHIISAMLGASNQDSLNIFQWTIFIGHILIGIIILFNSEIQNLCFPRSADLDEDNDYLD